MAVVVAKGLESFTDEAVVASQYEVTARVPIEKAEAVIVVCDERMTREGDMRCLGIPMFVYRVSAQ